MNKIFKIKYLKIFMLLDVRNAFFLKLPKYNNFLVPTRYQFSLPSPNHRKFIPSYKCSHRTHLYIFCQQFQVKLSSQAYSRTVITPQKVLPFLLPRNSNNLFSLSKSDSLRGILSENKLTQWYFRPCF